MPWHLDAKTIASVTLIGVAAVLGPSAAHAYVSCYEPSKPYIPSAGSADFDSMETAGVAVRDYNAAVDAYLDCLQQEFNAVETTRQDVNKDWDYQFNWFNSLQQ